MKQFLLILFLLAASFNQLQAQLSSDVKENIKAEIEALNNEERQAFAEGNCEKVISFFDSNVSFFANGRRAPSLEFILSFCKRVPRPFAQGAMVKEHISVLAETVVNHVKYIELPLKSADDKVRNVEVVTRTWNKKPEGWKIVHFHSSVASVAIQ